MVEHTVLVRRIEVRVLVGEIYLMVCSSMAELSAVNRTVTGSNPVIPAILANEDIAR